MEVTSLTGPPSETDVSLGGKGIPGLTPDSSLLRAIGDHIG